MRITAIDIFWLRLPLPKEAADAMTDLSHWDFIGAQVQTDEGPSGWGYNCTYSTDGGWLGFSESQLLANAGAVKAAGFRGFKMKIGKPTLEEDVSRVTAVRRALGPGFPLMVDANGRWNLMTARRAIDALGGLDIYWFEEPLHPFDVAGHAALAQATNVPILAGETMYDLRMFRDFMVAGAMSIAQPDVLKLGGISGWMEVASLARAFGLPVVPAAHNMMQLDVHLLAAIPHGLMIEHIPWLTSVFERPVKIDQGYAIVPHEPGAGTDVRAEAIKKYRAD